MESNSIICPYCNYNFYEDMPDISLETEAYMINNKIDIPKSSVKIFDEADTYHQCQLECIEVTCYKCNKNFKVHRKIVYRAEK